MKYCQNCGKKIKRAALFCPYCGAKQFNNTAVSNQETSYNIYSNKPTSINWLWLIVGYMLPIVRRVIYYVLWKQPTLYKYHISINLDNNLFNIILEAIILIIAYTLHCISTRKNYNNKYFKYADNLLIILSALSLLDSLIFLFTFIHTML